MTPIGDHIAAAPSQLPVTLPPRRADAAAAHHSARPARTDRTDELRKHFQQFVGETFFGQMLKAMRATVGKPAYFHGGRAEEVFRGQLDQSLAEHMTAASADQFADPLFERQFPYLAAPNRRENPANSQGMNELAQLTRR